MMRVDDFYENGVQMLVPHYACLTRRDYVERQFYGITNIKKTYIFQNNLLPF